MSVTRPNSATTKSARGLPAMPLTLAGNVLAKTPACVVEGGGGRGGGGGGGGGKRAQSTKCVYHGAYSFVDSLVLRGTIVNRTYGTH